MSEDAPVEVWIETDEVYPVFFLHTAHDPLADRAEVLPAKIEEWKAAMVAFWMVQREMREAIGYDDE